MKKIYIASTSKHKTGELRQMLNPFGYEVHDLTEFADYVPPEETGATFLENAHIKARGLRSFLADLSEDERRKVKGDSLVLADDSGLECEDLGGAPGVYSARYSGPHATDATNNAKLIADLQTIPLLTRAARYVCALILITADGAEKSIVATCEGCITFEPKGQNGFGYDPYFYLPELNKTMAELSPEEKNRISHRGKALRQLLAALPINHSSAKSSKRP